MQSAFRSLDLRFPLWIIDRKASLIRREADSADRALPSPPDLASPGRTAVLYNRPEGATIRTRETHRGSTMSIIGLLVAAVITAIIVYLTDRKAPAPWHWLVYGLLIVLWLIALITLLPIDLGGRIG